MDIQHKGTVDAEARRARREALAEQICLHVLFAGLGALLCSAELLFGAHPFGLSLAAASNVLFPAVALGGALFAALTGDHLTVAALGLLALVRLGCAFFSSGKKEGGGVFTERLGVRLCAVAGSSLAVGIFALLRADFRYYNLFSLLLCALAATLATFLLSGLFSGRERLFPYSREVGLGTLILLSVFALRAVSLIGIYPAAVAAALVSFWLSSHRGSVYGAVFGLLAGLCFDPILSPGFLLLGLGFGLLEKSSRGGGILAGCGVAAAYAFAVGGVEAITKLLPALLTAGALFLAGDSAGIVEGSPVRRLAIARRRNAALAARAMEHTACEKRVGDLCTALGDISGILYELGGKQRRPGLMELRHLCDREFDRVCPNCRNREICWGSEYNATAEAVSEIGTHLHTTGTIDRSRIPSALAARCRALPDVLEGITNGAELLFEEALRGDKTSVVAGDYAALSRMFTEMLDCEHEEHITDVATAERLSKRLQRLGYAFETVCVCGKHHRRVLLHGLRLPGQHVKIRELRRILEESCHFSLGEAQISQSEGMQDYLFCERATLQSTTVRQTRAKAREGSYCGDSVMSFSTAHGYDYAYLCDGMGSGNNAALCSALCSTLLSRFLRAGGRAESALRTLNGVLAARGRRESETSSTVDLLQIDRVSGEAALFKCGAAPTYLLRRGQLTRFHSRTAPIGILEALDAERISFEVEAGDVIVQVSDGVTHGEEDCPWLSELLQTRWDGDAEKLARTVLARADEEGKDDLSILVTEITAAPLPGSEENEKSA